MRFYQRWYRDSKKVEESGRGSGPGVEVELKSSYEKGAMAQMRSVDVSQDGG